MVTRVIIFDWNGTLLDDTPIWHEAVKGTFRTFGSEAPTIAEYFRELKNDYLEIYRSRGIEVTRDELNGVYGPLYESLIVSAQLMPGAKETLKALVGRTFLLYLVSMQPGELVWPLLEKFKIQHFFREYFCGVTKKNETILSIVKKLGVSPDDCFMISDTPSDVRQANKAGVVSVAYLTSYIPHELFVGEAEPVHTITNLKQLPVLI